MSRLLLLTDRYPFAWEPFLDPELPRLASTFSEIELAPVVPVAGSETPVLPAGVRVAALPARNGTRATRAIGALLRVPLDAQGRAWLQDELPAARRFGRRGVVRLLLFLREALRVRDGLLARGFGTGPALLYSYWLGGTAAGAAMLKERHPSVRAISRAHGADVYVEQSTPPYLPLQGRILRTLDRTFAVSEDGRARLADVAPGASIEVRRLGVEAPARMSPASDDGVLRLLTCSRPVAVKRLDRLVDALGEVAVERIEWTHVGGEVDEGRLDDLKARASSLPARVRTRFTGMLPHAEVLALFERGPFDAFVNVSESEGLPIALAEAMRRGIPAIATAVGGTAELVDDATGRLLAPNVTAPAIARAIEAFAALPSSTRSAMRSAAAARVADRMEAERNYGSFARELRGLVDPSAVS